MNTLFRDFRNQVSWGRVCAAVALVVAVVGQFKGIDVAHLQLWLGVALGNYGASKVTEMICARRTVEVEASTAPGGQGVPTPYPNPDGGNS